MSQVRPIEDLFAELIELKSTVEREAYLAERCGDDVSLRGQLEKLLAAYEKAGSFLAPSGEVDPTVDVGGEDLIGKRVGPYTLRERLGIGGMGVVWAADQKKPLRRKVALKLIKPGMDTEQVIARFDAERAALALMDHPNIARVLDAGTTELDRPYFVMELIRGVPITKYCDAQRLTIQQRLSLFMQVCKAVQHAHQKGIIHRDIKPSNVLVTEQDEEPVPKVIDFGVAKALHQPLTERSLYSGVFQAIGTLAYMSPEQAGLCASDVDTRADIYGLGVLLYELLTGSTPFGKEELASAAFDEACRIIREKEPPKPSTRISTLGERAADTGRNRSVDPRGLGRIVRGDLDWIVSKSLEKDRRRRYETADALAADLQKHLRSEPVDARPPSTVYRLSRFYRRNKALVGTGFFVFVIALVAAVGTTSGWIVADWRRVEAEESAAEAQKERDKNAATLETLEEVARLQAIEAALNLDQERMRSAIKTAREAGASEGWERMAVAISELFGDAPERAVETLREAQSLGEDTVAVRSLLSEAYMYCGDMDSMLEVALPLMKEQPERAEDKLFLAMPMTRHDQARALRLSTEAFEQTRSPIALLVRASVYYHRALDTGDIAYDNDAIADATAALRLLPNSTYARATCLASYDGGRRRAQMLGNRALESEYESRARDHAVFLIGSPSTTPWRLTNIGYFLDDVGDQEEAEACFARAAAGSNNQAYFVSCYVHALLRTKDVARAESMLQHLRPEDSFLTALTLSKLDSQRQHARERLVRLLEDADAVSDDQLVIATLALGALYEIGYPEEGSELAKAIVKERGDSREFYCHLVRYFAGTEGSDAVLELAGNSRVKRGLVLLSMAQYELGNRRMTQAEEHLRECASILQGFITYERCKDLLARIEDPSRHADWWKRDAQD